MTNDGADGGSSSPDEDAARDRARTLVREKKKARPRFKVARLDQVRRLVVAAVKRRGMIDGENRLG